MTEISNRMNADRADRPETESRFRQVTDEFHS